VTTWSGTYEHRLANNNPGDYLLTLYRLLKLVNTEQEWEL
jgi:hypothetical protein